MSRHFITPALLAVSVLALAGCASVSVVRVTEGSQQPEGLPFYLPRPYVQVYEPFVIGSKPYLVSGKLSPDGKYLLVDNVSDQGALDGLFRSDLSKEQAPRVPVNVIRKRGVATDSPGLTGSAQGGTETSATAAAPASAIPAASAASAASAPDSAGSAPTGTQPSGNFNVSVTNTTSLFPPTLGRRFFDVVWMPDFEEKYVVQGKPGLGNTNIGVTMTQGWGLYGLDARVDNSAIVKPLLDFYSTGFDALGKLAKSKIFPAGELTGGGAQGAIETAELPPGARVTVKVTRVQVVAPGLYPILKPKEVSGATEASSGARDLVTRHIPLRPYTNIAFNTYEVVVVEVAKPTGDTPMNLQRYFDPSGADGALVPPAPANNLTGGGSGATLNVADLEKKVNELLANRKGSDGAVWKVSGLKQDNSNLIGTATLSGGTAKPTGIVTMADLGTFVANQTGSKVLPGNVKLTEAK
ncbi:hypothetical protein KAK07_13355 [Ideonella sp. 4Y16]|uniref:hypothetical protein n=1 Tax=Ideonella alba TaxID=2824118 RepID=UPI001B393AA6|nr:hypothetical protein [Ideonella alba]MBQ0944322.1 hypothetical protein [Ideonella alba]